jgi:hypothetical protein
MLNLALVEYKKDYSVAIIRAAADGMFLDVLREILLSALKKVFLNMHFKHENLP